MFREFEPVDMCRHILLHVGPVVIKIVLNLFSGSNLQVYEVEPRGCEALTSAVQSQNHIVVHVRRRSEIPAK